MKGLFRWWLATKAWLGPQDRLAVPVEKGGLLYGSLPFFVFNDADDDVNLLVAWLLHKLAFKRCFYAAAWQLMHGLTSGLESKFERIKSFIARIQHKMHPLLVARSNYIDQNGYD